MTDRQTDMITASAKQSPPWFVLALDAVAGIPLERWVLIMTMVYTLLQIWVLLRDKFMRRVKK